MWFYLFIPVLLACPMPSCYNGKLVPVAESCSGTSMLVQHRQSPPLIYTASIPSRIYLPFLGKSASFRMIYSLKKVNMVTPSLRVTCEFLIAQTSATAEQFCQPNITDKSWVKTWYGT